jgi:hypothetical protein
VTIREITGVLMTLCAAVTWLWVEYMRNPNRFAKTKIGDFMVLLGLLGSLALTGYHYFKG